MKYFQFLLLLLSCTTPQKQVQPTPLFWDILEGYNSFWNKKQIIERLGKPQEIIKQENKNLWVYNSPTTNYQIWAVGIAPEKKLYIFEVEQRWKSLNCVHKKETQLSADNFQTTRTLECDNGKKVAEYNKAMKG
jgi:hypothetical protein